MAIKTVLTVVGIEQDDQDLMLALRVCEAAEAHLSVLVMGLAVLPPVTDPYMATFGDVWLEERRLEFEKLEARTAAVSALLAASPVSSDVTGQYVEGASADETVGLRARYADIVLIGQANVPSGAIRKKAIEGVLFASGKPLLVAPRNATPSLRPKRVLVAWDSSLEASRAVREALDLLASAAAVNVVLVDPIEGDDAQGAEPGADIATFLARHGVKVTVDRLPSGGHDVSDVLRRHAVDVAADLLVMGAYGHSRLRERILGGVTHSMIEAPPLPVLLAR